MWAERGHRVPHGTKFEVTRRPRGRVAFVYYEAKVREKSEKEKEKEKAEKARTEKARTGSERIERESIERAEGPDWPYEGTEKSYTSDRCYGPVITDISDRSIVSDGSDGSDGSVAEGSGSEVPGSEGPGSEDSEYGSEDGLALDVESARLPFSGLPQLPGLPPDQLGLTLAGSLTWIPGVHFSPREANFFHVFVHGFLPSISPQVCHPQLLPGAIFMLQGAERPFLRDVFLVCGAAFLSTTLPEHGVVARQRYARSLAQFANELSRTTSELQEWMVAAMLLFCLRDKMVGSTPQQPASHLRKAIELIRTLRTAAYNRLNIKFMVESALFNYSVIILTGGRAAGRFLPSPFALYDEWREVLEQQPYATGVPWMNYPVFGAAALGFELAAKALWLVAHRPLSAADMAVACDLLGQTYTLDKADMALAADGTRNQHAVKLLQDSVLVQDLLQLACQLLLTRLLHPTLELLHSIVQSKVQQLVCIIADMSARSSVWVICGWPLLVIGLCTQDPAHRELIQQRCRHAATRFHTRYMAQVGEFLEKVWATDYEAALGWEHVFDEIGLQLFCL